MVGFQGQLQIAADIRYRLRRHAGAVVGGLQIQKSFLFPQADTDLPGPAGRFNPMIDGVLHERLQDQFGDAVLCDGRRGV